MLEPTPKVREHYNTKLRMFYGLDAHLNLPRFQLVWSTGLMERRAGTFEAHYGNIFLRSETGVKDVLKYPVDQDRYILEHLTFNPHNDVVSGVINNPAFSYEPLWVFNGPNKTPQHLLWKGVEYLVKRYFESIGAEKKTDKDLEAEDKAQIEKEAKEVYEYLWRSDIEDAFAAKSAVSLGGKQWRQ